MSKAIIVISAPSMYGFVQGHVRRLRAGGYQALVVSAPSPSMRAMAEAEGASVAEIPMERDIAPLRDAVAFMSLCRLIARERPEAIMSMGPKATLIGNVAGWVMCVPRRVSLYVGIRQETMSGFGAAVVDVCDMVALAAATHILAISASLRTALARRGLADESRIQVTGNGTTNGIPAADFPFDEHAFAAAARVRAELALPAHIPVIGFVGRVTEDKGFLDIVAAYRTIRHRIPQAHLVLVGPDETRTAAAHEALRHLALDPQVRVVGAVNDVRPYVHLFWVHLFPSHREGFGNATAEAAALAVPTVAYRVTGVMDAISDNLTGKMVDRGDVAGLAAAALAYLLDPALRLRHGLQARQRTLDLYHPDLTWAAFCPAFGLHLPLSLSRVTSEPPLSAELYVRREKALARSPADDLPRMKCELAAACGG